MAANSCVRDGRGLSPVCPCALSVVDLVMGPVAVKLGKVFRTALPELRYSHTALTLARSSRSEFYPAEALDRIRFVLGAVAGIRLLLSGTTSNMIAQPRVPNPGLEFSALPLKAAETETVTEAGAATAYTE